MKRRFSVHKTSWPMIAPFRITGYVFEVIDMVAVEIAEAGLVGRGEGCGVYYLKDFADGMIDQLEALRDDIEGGLTRDELQEALPPGGEPA